MTSDPTLEQRTELPENLVLIGGEMELWGDDAPDTAPAHTWLVDRSVAPGSRVLVAGPHAHDVVARLLGRDCDVTVLVRGQRDALPYASTFPKVTVWCGDLARIPRAEPFTAVVALLGLEILHSADAELTRWEDDLSRLRAVAAPDATILLAVDNPVGVTALSASPGPTAADDDAAWAPYQGRDTSRPRTPADLAGRLGATQIWSAYPSTATPSTLLPGLASPRPRSAAAAHVIAGTSDARGPFAADPVRLVRDAVQANLAVALAPGWVAVAGGTSPAVSDVVVRADPASVRELAVDAPALGGDLLLDRFTDLCLAYDLPAIRALVGMYADWLATADGTVDHRVTNVLVDDAGVLSVLDPGRPAPEAGGNRLLASLADLAARLLMSGIRTPFPVGAGVGEVALLLAASQGVEADSCSLEGAHVDEMLRATTVTPDTVRRWEARNEALESKLSWYANALAQRDRQIVQERQRALRPDAAQWRTVRRREAKLAERLAAIESSRSYRLSRRVGAVSRRLGAVSRRLGAVSRRLRRH